MHCNGRCFLNKQLTKAEKPSSPLNTKSNEKFGIQFFCISLTSSLLTNFKVNKAYQSRRQKFTAQEFIHSSFRPPQV